ncbi:MAG: lysophospholipid acyltransferase family protein [Bacteroidaceae bacterium]|nr:lysophospholipid acyltransferase family protein [Bacteroidaceae bacterium]
MAKFLSRILYGIVWVFSLLPMPLLYLFADIIWLIMFICPPLRYRKKIVKNNLALSFPEKDSKWLKRTERRFYYQFLCQIMESLKTVSASKRWIQRHMEFSGVDRIRKETLGGRAHICYLGHVGNWELVPSMMYHFVDIENFVGCQVYHKLENPVMEEFMLKLRGKYGTESIPMEQVMRRLLEYRNSGKTYVIGMIADQVPLWWNTHYWTQFFNRKTPVLTGAERLARKLDNDVWYFNISRKSRGHYHCDFQLMFDHTKDLPEFAVTEKYMRLLEDNIKECPELWLWTHNRWKRNYEEYHQWLMQHQNANRPRD